MVYDVTEEFERMRNEWAAKAVVTEDMIAMDQTFDRRANPHNEPYHNKPQIRERGQIVSDRAYSFADDVLKQQYGQKYKSWLDRNTRPDPHRAHIRRIGG